MHRDDPDHRACLELLSRPGELIVPMLAVAEAVHLIATRIGAAAEEALVRDIADGNFTLEPVAPSDWERIADLVVRYADLPLGTTDASVVATAERLGVTRIATLDRRHFSVVRPRHVEAFTLLP